MMRGQNLYDYCMENGRQELLEQWDEQQNLPITPKTVTYGTHRKMHWICEKGHHWEAQVRSRMKGTGCPYCANRAVLPGYNDLATVYPEISAQWDTEKNAPLTPQQVGSGDRRKAWWCCEKGHSWQSCIFSRTRGVGCPYCAGKRVVIGSNDLATKDPERARHWDYEKNSPLTPRDVAVRANRYAWFLCDMGHSYRMSISALHGCPYCTGRKVLVGFNDLATKEPEIAAQWHMELNAPLTPQDVTCGSHKKVWWECQFGHIWKSKVYSRAGMKTGCPVCVGRGRAKKAHLYGMILEENALEQRAKTAQQAKKEAEQEIRPFSKEGSDTQ